MLCSEKGGRAKVVELCKQYKIKIPNKQQPKLPKQKLNVRSSAKAAEMKRIEKSEAQGKLGKVKFKLPEAQIQ